MNEGMIERIYETVIGQVLPEYAVPGVNDLFAEGELCDRLYEAVYDAHERICVRLGEGKEDRDVQMIIDSMERICWLVAREMFRCGKALGSSVPVNNG